MAPSSPIALALHGGAGARRGRDYSRQLVHLSGLAEQLSAILRAGASALDVATEAVGALEASGLYVAGRGAGPNTQGGFELDASLMDGPTARATAIGLWKPLSAATAPARAVGPSMRLASSSNPPCVLGPAPRPAT